MMQLHLLMTGRTIPERLGRFEENACMKKVNKKHYEQELILAIIKMYETESIKSCKEKEVILTKKVSKHKMKLKLNKGFNTLIGKNKGT